jgi:hypothetical protein
MCSCVITHEYTWNAQNGHSIHSTYLFQYRKVARMLGILLFFVVCTIFDSIADEHDDDNVTYSMSTYIRDRPPLLAHKLHMSMHRYGK